VGLLTGVLKTVLVMVGFSFFHHLLRHRRRRNGLADPGRAGVNFRQVASSSRHPVNSRST